MEKVELSEGDDVEGQVQRVLRRAEDDVAFGLLVDVGYPAFVPRSLVPADRREDLDALVGQWMQGAIFRPQEDRPPVVKPESFSEQLPSD